MRNNAIHAVKQGVFHLLVTTLLRFDQERLCHLVYLLIKGKSKALPPADSLKFLFTLENRIFKLADKESVRYGNGIHSKHRHIKYHDFFVNNIEPGSRVLDIGCGNGAVAFDVATRIVGVFVYGIDLNPANIEQARNTFSAENIRFICGDAFHDLPDQQFDVMMLSNVLEHLEHRVRFLSDLQQRYQPRKFLIRVPLFERDWQVPLQEELGVDYRLDKTHCIEYRREEFLQEIREAGLSVVHSQINWGEIWAEVKANAG